MFFVSWLKEKQKHRKNNKLLETKSIFEKYWNKALKNEYICICSKLKKKYELPQNISIFQNFDISLSITIDVQNI